LKQYPAISVGDVGDPDILAAAVDEFSPTAIESRESDTRVFFATPADRDTACAALSASFDVTAIDVPDEDWARRSQENLQPITVGRIIVATPWAAVSLQPSAVSDEPSAIRKPVSLSPQPSAIRQPLAISHDPSDILIVIAPSMGFGTGHHATTRLCLAALQAIDLTDKVVLDVGTGSGVLAIAAERLGARRASGIDNDQDAIQSARENLEVNPAARRVTFDLGDLTAWPERSGRIAPRETDGPRGFPPSLELRRTAEALAEAGQPIETGSPERLALQLRSGQAGRPGSGQADVVTANLTGGLLVRSASALLATVRAGGTLILSGLLAHERDEVCRAFAPAAVVWEQEEDGWVGLAMKKP
jgi:ribosomal protein L11 methylase PrmA